MEQPKELFFPIEKAIYLFNRATRPGSGGDKRKFWQEILGYDSPEKIRSAILDSVKARDLMFRERDFYGNRYQAVTVLNGPTGASRLVRTGWIVRHNEKVARFVTAVPGKRQGGKL